MIRDPLIIIFLEVLGDVNLLAFVFECQRGDISVESNITHDVLPLVTPISNNALANKFVLAFSHPFVTMIAALTFYLHNSIVAGLSALESENRV